MAILHIGKTRRAMEAMASEIGEMRAKMRTQALIIDDITTAQRLTAKRYAGNEYREYLKAIQEVAKKYQGLAEWGVVQTGSLLETRAAFIIGQGVAVIPNVHALPQGEDRREALKKLKDSDEMKFAREFFEYNDIDREMAKEFAKEAEIEGCFLAELVWDAEKQMVSVQFVSRADRAYTIEHKDRDYSWYTRAYWKPEGRSADVSLDEKQFVYIRFGGRIHKPNEPMPKIAKCLTQIESIDKALRDWREINNLFASPIPYVSCPDAKSAETMAAKIEGINWKARKAITLVGDLKFASPDMQGGIESLENEILTNCKMVSGTTGVPVGFMGLGELTTKLGSESEVTSDVLISATEKERTAWIGGYDLMLQKAMEMRNANVKTTPLQTGLLKTVIPQVTPESWKRIVEVYLPLYDRDAIDLGTFLAQIPGIDVDAEIEKAEERSAKKLERFEKISAGMGGDDDEGEDDE